ncbi:MAG: hypothetical protein ACON4O_06085 [Lentimonas sp.]
MKPRTTILLSLIAFVIIVAYFLLSTTHYPLATDEVSFEQVPTTNEAPPIDAVETSPLTHLGNQFLEGHGSANTTGAQDLQLVGRMVDGMHRLFKNLDTRHVSTNEQLTAYLTGSNPEGLQYLDPKHAILKGGRRLIDRWGQPYIVHPLGTAQLELRSSGPDQISYTEDDILLHPEYIRGE